MGAWRLGFSLGQPCWVAAQQEDMCGRKGNQEGGISAVQALQILEMIVIKTAKIYIDTDSGTVCLCTVVTLLLLQLKKKSFSSLN